MQTNSSQQGQQVDELGHGGAGGSKAVLKELKQELANRKLWDYAGVTPSEDTSTKEDQKLPPVKKSGGKGLPSTSALMAVSDGNQKAACVYCGQHHPSVQCTIVTNAQKRKEISKKSGRCFICIRKNHFSRNFLSRYRCSKCDGRHDFSICDPTDTSFGLSSSPFLLNATLKHHIMIYESEDPEFVQKLLQTLYVDDNISGESDDMGAYKLYIKAKSRRPEDLEKFTKEPEGGRANQGATMLLLWCCRAGASVNAYAAVVYLKIETADETYLKFLTSKTRVAPLVKQTNPRFELLSALILARLISHIRSVLEEFILISHVRCWSDSEVPLYWIRGEDREWKQFVRNRICEVRSLVPPTAWSHCSSKDNQADIAPRGTSPAIVAESTWISGPDWLKSYEEAIHISEETAKVRRAPVQSLQEAKKEHRELTSNLPCLSLLTGFSSLASKGRESGLVPVDITADDILEAEELWIRDIQIGLTSSAKFKNWKGEFGVFSDPSGILRCAGSLGNTDLSELQKHPALLDANHHVTSLIDHKGATIHLHSRGLYPKLSSICYSSWTAPRIEFRQLEDLCVASKVLRSLFYSLAVRRHLANKGVKWIFNLESTPWWGSYFERLVQSVKRCLKKILKDAKVTSEELQTVLVEIGATLNSRPLTFVSSGEIEEPLTPYHLFCGRRLLAMPDQVEIKISPLNTEEARRRVALLERLKDHFWVRWKNEYLLELRNSHRLKMKDVKGQTVVVGYVVVVHEDGLHRGLWRLGRVESLIEGKDGLVRGVVVKTTTPKKRNPKRLRRPLQRSYPLELGTGLQGDSTVDIPDVPTGTEQAEVRPSQGAAGIADITNVLDGAEDAAERSRREAAHRADRERRVLMENKLL
ncbi:hypothetical protein AWC38_SpisGene12260 [Stylophora pistillata]|uniref:DUF5641 domain-containing protein n=1 Tax=Stylophora pistillata TaxID=50429 RepID=A0A2B4RXK0_STYPI|nr:hypothetical protein AWC38_SpisGene12260 [Stylophora pistillata]